MGVDMGDGSARGTCPGCGQPTEVGARFCAACGAPLAAPEATPSIPVGERRQLTILFCDLVGSTALSERLDPEDLGDVVLAYQEMGRATVQRFGGHVAQYLGDGLLAYFGYPIAHEDDADRSVLAGLELLEGLDGLNDGWAESLGVRLDARVGIHAGPAVVGAMGSADRSDTSAFGNTPNVAARIEGHAAPGTVALSEDVRRALGPRFTLADLGTPELKGVSRPLRLWQVSAVSDPVARRAGPAGTGPVIGRDLELATALDCLRRAQGGGAHTVLLTGEPGIGKSRLVQAIFEQVADTPHTWLEGQCSELSSDSTLAPVVDLLRRSLDLDDERTDGDWDRLVDALAPLGSITPSTTRYLADLLGVGAPDQTDLDPPLDDGPELRRRRTMDALVDWTRLLGGDQLVVIVLEDLHWSDASTLELVRLLTRADRACRLLCVLTSRSGAVYGWEDDDGVTTIALSPLDAMESEQLTRALAGAHGLADDVLDAVADRSDGVPLFIEELVKAAAESAGQEARAEIPGTLQALLAARLDRLGRARGLAQAASVLGREFPLELLAATTGRPIEALHDELEELRTAGLLATRNTPGGVMGVFRHALIQDAAYASVLRRERRELHRVVSTVLVEQFGSTVVRSPELIAHHLERAGQHLEASGWYERAGRLAAQRAALAEARSHLRRGLEVLEEVDTSPDREARLLTLNILLGNVLMGSAGMSSDEALPVWERAIAAAEHLGDHDELTSALNGAAVFHADRANTATAIELAERILRVADDTGSRVASLRGNGTLGMIRLYQGDGARAQEHLDLAMSLSRDGDFFSVTYGIGHDEETYFHMIASWVQWWLGYPDRALATARRGLDIALGIPSSLSQAMARHALAAVHHLRGEREEAEAVAMENLALCSELDFPFWGGLAATVAGAQRSARGDPGGIDQLNAGLDRLGEIGNMGGAAFGMVFLAEANLMAGRAEAAVEAAELGVAAGEVLGQPFYEAELLHLQALALAKLGRGDDARRLLERGVELANAMGARSIALRACVSLAHDVGGDEPERAVTLVEEALAAMGDGADTPDQRRARDLLARLHVAP